MTAAILALALLHESGVSSSRMELRGGELRVTFVFSLEDLAGLARLDADRNGLVEPDEWTRVMPALFAYLGDHFRIDGCRSEGDAAALPGTSRMGDLRAPVTLAMRYVSPAPMDRLTIRCDLFREHGGDPRHIAELPGGSTVVFDQDRSTAERPIATSGFRWIRLAGALGILATIVLGSSPALKFRNTSSAVSARS